MPLVDVHDAERSMTSNIAQRKFEGNAVDEEGCLLTDSHKIGVSKYEGGQSVKACGWARQSDDNQYIGNAERIGHSDRKVTCIHCGGTTGVGSRGAPCSCVGNSDSLHHDG